MLKKLKEIRRLGALALDDIINVQEYWMVNEVAEIETLDSIQVKLQAILRNADEALEADNDILTELDHGHRALTAARVPLSDNFGILSLAERIGVLHSRNADEALEENDEG